jgi:penicillin-binding protein 2
VFGDFPVTVAGKTGTAEYKPKQPIAWYAGYAPAEAPRYVVVAMVEEGGGGSLTAAPIVRRVLEGLFPQVEETEIDPGVARTLARG